MRAVTIDPLVRLDSVSHHFRGPMVLEDVTLSFEADAFVGIVGPSGSGKTTLLRLLVGAMPPCHGQLHRRAGLRVGYVPQVETINWNFPVTVQETVLMSRQGSRVKPWTSATEKKAVAETLDRLGIGHLASRHIRQLSGGQQQRVFIARALIGQPDLLLLDEPTSGVDVRTRHDVLHLLGDLNAGGLAIILTTHDLNGIAAHLPRLVCLNTRITGVGTPHQVLTPSVLEATYGAPMEVLQHLGMPLIVETGHGFGRQQLGA
jgi:zinc/manganese transport system ATP-binding protein